MKATTLFFLQKTPGPDTEQLGCYSMNIWQAATLAAGCRWVEPMIPFAPRDNQRVEAHSDESWETSILTYYQLPASKIFRNSPATGWITLAEFYQQSAGRADLGMLGPLLTVDPRTNSESPTGYTFFHDPASTYKILPLPRRWDLVDGRTFREFVEGPYASLPFRLGNKTYPERATIHWRRGDRGNVNVGDERTRLWERTEPVSFGTWAAHYLIEAAMEEVAIMTNSGSQSDRTALEKALVDAGFKGRISWILSEYLTDPTSSWKCDMDALDAAAGSQLILLSPRGISPYGSAFGRILVAETVRRGMKPAVLVR